MSFAYFGKQEIDRLLAYLANTPPDKLAGSKLTGEFKNSRGYTKGGRK